MDNIRSELKKAFIESDLSLSDANYSDIRHHIYQLGSEYRALFQQTFGEKIWERAMHSDMPIRYQDQIRIFGFGAAITQYMVMPLKLSRFDRDLIIQIGAQANFIVTYFDHYIDSCHGGQALLPKPSRVLDNKLSYLIFYLRSWHNPKVRLLNLMIQNYLALLKELTCSLQRPELVALLHRAIRTMYQAELTTDTEITTDISKFTLRQKSALPFVVMSLPAWLAIREIDKPFFKMHLMWSYRFGIFIGLLDDAVDLTDDLINNQPNIFLKDNPVVQTLSAQTVAKTLAQKGVRIKALWSKMILGHQHEDTLSEFLFPALIRSWIGDG